MRITWIQPEDLLAHELTTSRQEGRDVDDIARRWTQAGGSDVTPPKGASPQRAPEALRALAIQLLDELDALPVPEATDHPEALADIAACWPSDWDLPATNGNMDDRVLGAWLGRASGCLLGKPVEGIAREGIGEILRSTGQARLSGYFTAEGLDPEVAQRWPWNRRSRSNSLRENIDGMPEDDDLNFPLLALQLLEDHGSEFTSADVATAWLDQLPARRVFTAERVAYRNLLLGHPPPDTATVHNPFREWIGAQIRTDVYGWTHPGRPDAAARLAYRDAVVSHVRNGVYGAMFAAAMGSAAMVSTSVSQVLDAGEAVLPPRSRIAAAVAHARALAESESDWDVVVDQLQERYAGLHWVHVLNNAALVAAALTHGQGDFVASICAVVSAGWDTDSNGATVGGITGALSGAKALPAEWIGPLKGRLRTSLPGLDNVEFEALAQRTLQQQGR